MMAAHKSVYGSDTAITFKKPMYGSLDLHCPIGSSFVNFKYVSNSKLCKCCQSETLPRDGMVIGVNGILKSINGI